MYLLPGIYLGVLLSADPPPSKKVAQNPSPMVEHTRRHERLTEAHPPGRRENLELGTLFIPDDLRNAKSLPLFIHFHGGTWLSEVAAAKLGKTAVISIQMGSGSAAYAKPFKDRQAFGRLVHQAEEQAGVRFERIGLTAWSAGYGSIREILGVPEYYDRVQFVILIDGLHAGYVRGEPGPRESELVTKDLNIFVRFARDAAAGKKQMLVTHSEIFPGTFASTTETADYLLGELRLKRRPVLEWGPRGMQQLGVASQGKFRVLSFAGNSAPDHVDQLHALPELLQRIDWNKS